MNAASNRLPALFVGHGSPTNALESNPFTAAWQRLGQELPPPRAILAVSAHWYTRGSFVTVNVQPPTIHDFGGFARELYDVQYPGVRRSGARRARVAELLQPVEVAAASDWGLDHGTWSVLVHAYPEADVPVVQLSVDADEPAAVHYALGKRLAPLRDEGVLVLGSGGIVHNLRRLARANGRAARRCGPRSSTGGCATGSNGASTPRCWTSRSSARVPAWRSRRPSTTCRCCTCSARKASGTPHRSR